MPRIAPGEMEVYSYFRIHLGPRCQAAGLRIQFHYNQTPGIHFKVAAREEYRGAIMKGIQDGMTLRFPDFPSNGSVWITEVTEHDVESCKRAFYRAGRLVVDQSYSLMETAGM